MSDTCPKCGSYCGLARGCVSAQLREQLAKAEAEAKRYREAWIALRSYVNSELTNWDIRNGDRWLQTQLVAMTMDDLIPPAEQG